MANVTVNSSAALLSAVKAARGGDTISLQAGTYSSVNFTGINIAGGVTIKSADAGRPAVLTDLQVKNSSGLQFSNLEFVVDPKKMDMPFQVNGSSNISFDKLWVHGTLNGSSADDLRGMLVRTSTNVSITNSRFEQLSDALSHIDSRNVTFSNNRFEYIHNNGIAGGGTSQLTIANNYFASFDHTGDIHPDAIQIWTTNTTKSATDITVTGNTFNRGSGEAIQGIFISDEVGNLPYQRVTVTNNTIVGAAYNGISIGNSNGVTLTGNTVIAVQGQPSWIGTKGAKNVVATDNIASDFNFSDSTVTKSGNVKAATATVAQAAALTGWLSNKSTEVIASGFETAITNTIGLKGFVEAPAAQSTRGTTVFTETVLKGTDGADRMNAGAIGDYRLEGGAGDDTFTGNAKGRTTMVGGLGNDTYVVKTAGDIVVEKPGEGIDTVVTSIDYTLTANVENIRLAVGGLTVYGNELDNTMTGSSGNDIMYGGGGNDVMLGGAGDDILYGGEGNNTLKGDDGNDQLYGGSGNDLLYGGAGNDILSGRGGNDIYEGGAGKDKLIGGDGQDTFVYRTADFAAGLVESMDTIIGFSSAQKDKIHLGMVDAKSATAAIDKFAFIGTDNFHKVAGELRYKVSGGDAYVMGDTNGDGVADFQIHLVGVTSLSASDFVL